MNGFSGADARPAGAAAHFSDPVSVPMPAGLSGTLNLANANIVPMDVDGDGRSDLLHMPRLDRYGFFTPSRQADAPGGAASASPADQGWAFGYVEVELPRIGDDPRIDFVRDGTHYKVFDVNNYLREENRVLRQCITGRIRLDDTQRRRLARKGKRLGRKRLGELCCIVDGGSLMANSPGGEGEQEEVQRGGLHGVGVALDGDVARRPTSHLRS